MATSNNGTQDILSRRKARNILRDANNDLSDYIYDNYSTKNLLERYAVTPFYQENYTFDFQQNTTGLTLTFDNTIFFKTSQDILNYLADILNDAFTLTNIIDVELINNKINFTTTDGNTYILFQSNILTNLGIDISQYTGVGSDEITFSSGSPFIALNDPIFIQTPFCGVKL